MKMVKSLLLGSAAGLVAAAGAQAADLPVKAKAVEYVKVCSLYGAGFYYIPGTDTCIKIGGFVRTEWLHNAGGSFATNIGGGTNSYYTRESATFLNRSRGIVTFDTRSQTEFGTLRSYIRAGWQWTTTDALLGGSGASTYLDRAFIQLAGFTFGKTQSFYDNFCMGCYSLSTIAFGQDTGGTGAHVFAYTAQLGNGVTATLSIEDQMSTRAAVVPVQVAAGDITNLGAAAATGAFNLGTTPTSRAHGNETPDIVGNIRVDQAWGSAQIQGALHLNQATYYTTGAAGGTAHPDDKWGWAVGAGFTLKMPWSAKDTLSAAVNYCEGAVKYCSSSAANGHGPTAGLVDTNSIAVGWTADSYFGVTAGNQTQLQLSEAFSVTAAFEHFWTPTLRQSIYGSYLDYQANSSIVSQTCTLAANVAQTGGKADCADWSAYQIGSRVLWNPVSNLDVGLDVMYSHIDTAFSGGTITNATVSGLPATLLVQDNHVWSGVLRLQRNFWP